MDRMGIRRFKADLSRQLRRVQAGTRLTITDRGRAIVTLAPAEAGRRDEWAVQMVIAGHARWNGQKPKGLGRRVASRGPAVSAAVIEDRR